MPKRKRGIAQSTVSSSKRKRVSASPHPHGSFDYQKEYKLRAIIGENKTKYQIDWEDGSETGEAYPPTWEPKANANELAVADWESKKAARTGEAVTSATEPKKRARNPKTTTGTGTPSAPAKKPARPRTIIDSSPEPQVETAKTEAEELPAPPSESGRIETEPELEIDETEPEEDDDDSLPSVPADNPLPDGRRLELQLSDPPSSYRTGAYQRIPEHSDSSRSSSRHDSSLKSSASLPITAETLPITTEVLKSTANDPPPSQVQNTGEQSTSLVVPESQSQLHQAQETSSPRKGPEQERAISVSREEVSQPGHQEQERATAGSQEEISQPEHLEIVEATTTTSNAGEHLTQQTEGPQPEVDAGEDSETATAPAPTVEPPATQSVPPSTSAPSQDVIVISSENEHGQNSSNDQPDNSAQFLSQAQYSPPPGAQRPIPSSVFKSSAEDQPPPAEGNGDTQDTAGTQSSFPFQTQLEPQTLGTRKTGSKPPAATPKRAALFNPPLRPTNSRPPSVSSVRSFNSPLPSIPSQPLGTLGESAPDRLRTPTPSQISNTSLNQNPRDPSMASNSATPSLSSQLKAIREGRRQTRRSQTPAVTNNAQPVSSLPPGINAEVAAARMASPGVSVPDGVRSPSAVPAIEPEPPVTREEMNTSERYETLLPQAQNNGLGYQGNSQVRSLVNSNSTIYPEDPNEDPEAANIHIVPIPFHGPQRDSYSNNIYHHDTLIERILAERHPVESLLEEAEILLQKLRDLATHPDLANHETLSQASEPDRQAQWDVDSSGKFCFLQKLFDALQDLSQSTHVAVAARGDRIPDMLETFCNGWFYTYSRSGKEHISSQPGKDKVRVTILDLDNETEMPEDADIVIALDGTTDHRHRVIRAARRHTKGEGMTRTNSWAMLLTLVVPKTVEHIERCLASDLPRAVRARVLVATARKLRHEACRKEHDGQDYAKEAARKVVEYLDDPEATEWPLGSLSQIQDLDSQTETELEVSHADITDPSEGSHPTKRARLSAGPALLSGTMNPQDMEITHVSDSLGKTTQPSLNEIFAPPTGPSAREQQLEEELARVQGRLEDHIRDLEEVQFRNEAQRTELAQKSSEREEAVSRVGTALNRMSMAENNNSTLKAERTELQKQLNEANAKLLDHSVPERADFERLRLEAEAINATKDKGDKSAEKAQNDMEWFRSMYQDSANKARELQAENNDLQARLAIAEKQASGEMARARQITQNNHHKKLDRENQKLRAIVKDREAAIRFRDEEITRLKESTRGRMGIRQSSVPRSPRLGSPMKLAGGRSRQASPAAGEPRGKGHPLRNSAG